MTPSPPGRADGVDARPQPDPALVDEAVAAMKDAKERAPADFLLALSVALGLGAIALLAGAVLSGGGVLQDLLLNLGAGLVGTWLTVVLVDGLWKRLETGASSSLDAMSARLEERKARPLSDDERRAWRGFVDEYRDLTRSESLLDRVRAIPSHRRRLLELERRARRALDDISDSP